MRAVLAGALACLTLGCASDTPIVGPRAALDITVLSGNNQEGFPRRVLPESLSVVVTDDDGNPVRGVAVVWEVVAAEGSVEPAESMTNSSGVASTSFTLGDAPASSVTAKVKGRDRSATFTAHANGFTFECAPPAVTNSKGDIRALSCAATAVGDFAGEIALDVAQVPTGFAVNFAAPSLDLTEGDGPVGTTAMLEIGFAVPGGLHVVVLAAEAGTALVTDSVLVTVR